MFGAFQWFCHCRPLSTGAVRASMSLCILPERKNYYMDKNYNQLIDSFVEASFADFKADLKAVVDIKSVAAEPAEGAPYGHGVAKALDCALGLAEKIGMEPKNCEGRIGYAHYGDTDKFIGIIGHVDVVPEGTGWSSEPYCLTEKGGYLIGRGVEDNKGGFAIGLYTAKFFIENKIPLKYGLRLLVGCDEEVGMSDVEYYKAHYDMPAFTLVPDAEFPVSHGEKGIADGDIRSKKSLSKTFTGLHAGFASNVVPEVATARLDLPLSKVEEAAREHSDITVSGADGDVTVTAHGISAHAGEPKDGINAIVVLCRFLCDSGLISNEDRDILWPIVHLYEVYDGTRLGIEANDGIFSPLTCIGGMIRLDSENKVVQNMNIRYPTNTTHKKIFDKISETAEGLGYELARQSEENAAYYIPAESDVITTLMRVYNTETKRNDKPYVMSGGTYARHIPNAAAFGMGFDFEKKPDYAGVIHGKNESLSCELAKLALKIYIKSVLALQDIEL